MKYVVLGSVSRISQFAVYMFLFFFILFLFIFIFFSGGGGGGGVNRFLIA